MGTGAI